MHVRDGAGGTFEVTSNAIGFRGNESLPAERVADTLVVQLYGDSMIHGTGVDDGDTISAQLQEDLKGRFPSLEVAVMNFGMPMNYLRSQLEIYETWGRRYHPDIVVLEYHGHVPSPRDINHRVRQIRESTLFSQLFRFSLGRRVINRYQTWAIGQYSKSEALAALRPGVELLANDQRERGVKVAVFSFVSDFTDLDEIFPPDIHLTRIDSGLKGWEGYRASPYIIAGDGHPNPKGTRMFASRIAAKVSQSVDTQSGEVLAN